MKVRRNYECEKKALVSIFIEFDNKAEISKVKRLAKVAKQIGAEHGSLEDVLLWYDPATNNLVFLASNGTSIAVEGNCSPWQIKSDTSHGNEEFYTLLSKNDIKSLCNFANECNNNVTVDFYERNEFGFSKATFFNHTEYKKVETANTSYPKMWKKVLDEPTCKIKIKEDEIITFRNFIKNIEIKEEYDTLYMSMQKGFSIMKCVYRNPDKEVMGACDIHMDSIADEDIRVAATPSNLLNIGFCGFTALDDGYKKYGVCSTKFTNAMITGKLHEEWMFHNV